MIKKLFLLSCFALLAVAGRVQAQTVIDQGDCGPTLTWTLNSIGVLNITGVGEMNDYSEYSSPFYNYRKSITQIIIGGEATSVGDYAFYQCANAKEVTWPKTMQRIGRQAFYGCHALDSVVMPEGMVSVGRSAFENCGGLKRVVIPSGIIDREAFQICDSLVDVRLGEGVTSIGYEAFSNCDGLTEITLPPSLESIGERAFYSNTKLARATIGGGIIGEDAFMYCTALEEVTLLEGVTAIGGRAFDECSALARVTLSEGLDSIGWKAFDGCESLHRIVIPSTVRYINGDVGWDDLQYVATPARFTPLLSADTVEVYSGDSILDVGGCRYLRLHECVSVIGDELCDGFGKLARVDMPGVKVIGSGAFRDCASLKHVELPATLDSIAPKAFYDSGLKELALPDGVVVGEAGMSLLLYGVFAYCDSLTSISFGQDVVLHGCVFGYCRNLREVVIPDGTTIRGSTFDGCSKLEYVTLPEGLDTIGSGMFRSCAIRSIDLPESVTFIGGGAFRGCEYLENVDFLSGISGLGIGAFTECHSIRSVCIPNSMAVVASQAFYKCQGLEELIVEEGVEKIGATAFGGCTSLKKVSLPSTITMIYGDAFWSNKAMEELTVRAVVPPVLERSSFGRVGTDYAVPRDIPVYVPRESLEAYRTAEYWEEFTNFLPIEDFPSVDIDEYEDVAPPVTYANGAIAVPAPADIKVYAQDGAKVRHAADATSLSLEGLPRGIYIICVEAEGQRQVMKVAR